MKSDTFFYKLVQQLPETLFVIQGLPEDGATDYGFAAAEVKKSYRLDGLLTPLKPGLPLYFVEFQFRRDAGIYANLFSKVFGYLNENDPKQNWVAVVIFGSRKLEPKSKYLAPYQPLLDSGLIRRFYLDEMVLAPDAHPCLKLLKLVCVPEKEAPPLVEQLIRHARQ